MTENNEDAKTDMSGTGSPGTTAAGAEENKDTISRLLDDRDRGDRGRPDRDHPKRQGTPEGSPEGSKEKAPERISTPEKSKGENPSETRKGLKDDGGDKSDGQPPASAGASPSEFEALKAKLQKTEKTLAENQRYGRTNAQKVSNALKVAQKLTAEGLLSEQEAKELLETLRKGGNREEEGEARGNEEREEDEGISHAAHPQASLPQVSLPQARLFAPIFKVANQELQNIVKYTDDGLLQEKVAAFDYFLSVGSQEETAQVLEELTELLDDPVKLAKKMLSIGHKVFEESYKGIQEAGGFKNYLSQKDQEIEKKQKKIDKLEKKLLQYEDFDQPRYRIDEMGDEDGVEPATDTISTLFEERDRVKRR